MISARALHVCSEALALSAGERDAFVAATCADDSELAEAVGALLQAHADSAGFLEPVLPVTPQRVGSWRLRERIGSGGMGQVWLAERDDGAFQQQVAIKILASALGDADSIRRANSERQFLAWLQHPNIARVIDGGCTPEGQPYVVMEYVEGERIDRWCRQQRLDLRARVRLFLQVLAAVGAAHRALIIHRDLKPSNVLVTGDGHVKLLDFGIAKSLDHNLASEQTGTGLLPMTPQYASPEQLAGQPLTTACDIHALGLLLYEMLAGQPARAQGARTLGELARMAEAGAPTRPSLCVDADGLGLPARALADWRRQLGGDLDGIVMKATATEPARRYPSAEVFANDLRHWLDRRPVAARGDSRRYRLAKFIQRNRFGSAAAALAVVAVLAGLLVAVDQAGRAEREAGRAREANRFLTDMISQADPFISGTKPSLEDALDRAAAEIGPRFEDQPDLEADIRLAIGRAYSSLNRLDAARGQLERSMALRASASAEERAEVLDALALLEWSFGRYQASEDLFRQALAGLTPSRQPRIEATVANDLAALLNELGRYDEALPMVERALDLSAVSEQLSLATRAAMHGNRGYALHGLERLDEAVLAYGQARALLELARPVRHADHAINFNNLALVLIDQGRHDEGLQLLEQSIQIRQQVFGGEHPVIVQAQVNLAVNYAQAGRLEAARETIDRALEQAPRQFPAGSQVLGHIHRNAARVLLATGAPERAVEEAVRALAIYDNAEAVEPGRREQASELLAQARAAAAAASMP